MTTPPSPPLILALEVDRAQGPGGLHARLQVGNQPHVVEALWLAVEEVQREAGGGVLRGVVVLQLIGQTLTLERVEEVRVELGVEQDQALAGGQLRVVVQGETDGGQLSVQVVGGHGGEVDAVLFELEQEELVATADRLVGVVFRRN